MCTAPPVPAGGYWVLGAEGEGDTAEYPVLKVFDCTNDLISVAIASDSDWELQDCTECESTVDGVGEVRDVTDKKGLELLCAFC